MKVSKNLLLLLLSSTVCATAFNSYAADDASSPDNDAQSAASLTALSLAELSEVSVTSVSKQAEKQTDAPAAIYVITSEDIKRSGTTNIPDALRMVPGIHVAQTSSNDFAITSRGFNSQFANKLLVLIDGRTVYSPLFAGVLWDVQDTLIEDIDRIEVIRGPGAALWGANAVNGVINITTKSAKDTVGGYVSARAGNQINGDGAVRYGAEIAENSYVRTYVKYDNHDAETLTTGAKSNGRWIKKQAGFRSDVEISANEKLTLQGDIYAKEESTRFVYPDLAGAGYANSFNGETANGGNLLARWTQKTGQDSEYAVQAYLDKAKRSNFVFNDDATTVDLDFQHNWSGLDNHEFVWGAGYRMVKDTNHASTQYGLAPLSRTDNLFNAFVQDKFAIVPETLFLTLGSKFEHNDYTGIEIQPSARLSWLVEDNQTVWASVSRAVHTPSRFTADGRIDYTIIPPGGLPALVQAQGNRNVDSEEMIAYELGYRIQPTKFTSVDIATFYNDYDKLFRDELGTVTIPGAYALQPVSAQNNNKARSFGAEVAAKWNVNSDWQLAGSYSYINLVFDNKDGGISSSFQGRSPKHQYSARSSYAFSDSLNMTNSLYYVDRLNGINIPSYYRLDTRVAYTIAEGLELSVVGQNLLDDRHKEFAPGLYQIQEEIGRSIYGNISYKF